MKLGLCLSGGGVKGAAHIGAIKALEEEKMTFDILSGTSSGSIVAALYGAGYTPDEIYGLFQKYAKKIKYVDSKNIFKGIYGLLFKRKILIEGLNSGKILEKIVNEACAQKEIYNIKDFKIPILIPSVNLKDGSIYIFCSELFRKTLSDNVNYINNVPIGRAVRASCSFPIIFEPCPYGKTKLIDGGVRENVPWKETKKLGADKVLSIVFQNELDENCCQNVIEVANRSLEILEHELSNYELEGADYLLKIRRKDVGLLDIDKLDELYELGYRQTKKEMNQIKKIVL